MKARSYSPIPEHTLVGKGRALHPFHRPFLALNSEFFHELCLFNRTYFGLNILDCIVRQYIIERYYERVFSNVWIDVQMYSEGHYMAYNLSSINNTITSNQKRISSLVLISLSAFVFVFRPMAVCPPIGALMRNTKLQPMTRKPHIRRTGEWCAPQLCRWAVSEPSLALFQRNKSILNR